MKDEKDLNWNGSRGIGKDLKGFLREKKESTLSLIRCGGGEEGVLIRDRRESKIKDSGPNEKNGISLTKIKPRIRKDVCREERLSCLVSVKDFMDIIRFLIS